jgi:C-5 cytosine-specific DNA methylase
MLCMHVLANCATCYVGIVLTTAATACVQLVLYVAMLLVATMPQELEATVKEPGPAIWELVRTCPLMARAPCCIHPYIACERPKAQIETDGTPCVDWSTLGNQLGWNGPQFKILCATVRAVLDDDVPVFVHENVRDFDFLPAMLEALKEKYIHHASFITTASDSGVYAINRSRRVDVFIHKQLARPLGDFGCIEATYKELSAEAKKAVVLNRSV